MRNRLRFLSALLLISVLPALATTEEQPPYEVKDVGANENFRVIFYAVDQLSAITKTGTSTCIDDPTFCVNELTNSVTMTSATATSFTATAATFTTVGLPSMTAGSVLFVSTNGLVSQNNSSFFWDRATNRLGLGTNTPGQSLVISGQSGLRSRLKIPEATNNLAKFEMSTDDSSTASSVQIAEITGTITQSDPSALKSQLELGVNTGDSLQTKVTIASNTVTFADPLYGPAGASSLPTYSFALEPNSGIYRAGSNDIRMNIAGIRQTEWTSTAVIFRNSPIYVQDGSNTAPGIAFQQDTNTGVFRVGTDSIGFTVGNSTAIAITSSAEVLQPFQPSFLATSTGAANVTGDATTFTVNYQTEIRDLGGDYNPATYTFTAPVTGQYSCSINVRRDDLFASATLRTRLVTSNRTYRNTIDLGATLPFSTFVIPMAVVSADMDANDTALVEIQDSGGVATKTIDVNTDSTINFFSCSLQQ